MKSPSPTYTPTDIQSHLYLSFLRGHTADVALHTKGESWEVVYQLHRVVLIQAGFFRSLFTAGFLESQQHDNNASPSGSPPDQVNICFDDLNITRSAFEVCLARLYGGGPDLYLSPSLIPTLSYPLTPSFYLTTPSPPNPPGHHPATPRFLLSLLVTSVYLSIPSITSQALSMILSSVGPHTVVRYINFATGLGIGASEGDDPEAAIGLEDVGKEVPYRDNSQPTMAGNIRHGDTDDSDISCKFSEFEESDDKDGSSLGGTYLEEPAFDYGGIGDKVGEACACWLMRWSADILPCEEDAYSQIAVTSEPSAFLHPVQDHSRRRMAMPSGRPSSLSKVKAPKLWGRGGLSVSWACAVISSNDFFIRSEWDRYKFASRVVNLRGRDGLDPNEEKEWAQLFQHGIHYSNMSFEELIRISQDISPVTGRLHVPLQTIESAHWQQSIFKHHIVTRSPVSGKGTGSPPPQCDRELGITLSTAEILATLPSDPKSDMQQSRVYYPVPVDSSQRIGNSPSAFPTAAASADELLGSASDLPVKGYPTPKQANFFGILSPLYTASSCIQTDLTGKARWSPYPPLRFAVEFWGVGQLLEKPRMYSHTIWYAGSLFNVYVQVVRKKGIQLGMYLHRQSSVDAIPRPSAPRVLVSTRGERLLNSTASSSPPGSPHPQPQSPSRGHVSVGSASSISSVTFVVPGSPPSSTQLQPSTASLASSATPAPVGPIQPYRDPRSTILAHFTISCSCATGSSLIRFSSSPDQFSIGQSWGWKSSCLRTEEHTELNDEAKARELNREATLRATVVLGLI